ncbi:vitamin B12-dependent ribonucleotide reductase [Lichenicoccus sp.]|uniref:TSCPD domain-containing protein n=1 Tax=Lichenicoccus sp. TaxID=2781899 RepID=UPI003D0C90A3
MKLHHLWNGVRMRTVLTDTDAFDDGGGMRRAVTLPVGWDDAAAAALAHLAPGTGVVALPVLAARWIAPLAAASPDLQQRPGLEQRLIALLLRRAACPGETVWRGAATEAACFVLNLASFAEPGAGFDLVSFVAALDTIAETLRLLGSRSARLLLGNLDAGLAGLGLDYDSDAGRDVAACLSALAMATLHPGAVVSRAAGAAPPRHCVVTGLAEQAGAAWQAARAQAPDLFLAPLVIETGFSAPGPVDALLGFEASGMAPVFSPLTHDGRLAGSTRSRLAARGIGPEAAFAASLAGTSVLRAAGASAMQAMQRAVGPFVDCAPSQTAPAAAPHAVPTRRELPARHGGFTQKAVVGGHRLFVRTGEYEDGSLGELAIAAVREGSAQRGLMDAFSQAVSLGLQHGVPLAAYVEAFAYSRFGPHGAVEGDAAVNSATSLLDYAFRTLAQAYLGRSLPDGPPVEAEDSPSGDALLPLDLPLAANVGVRRRHGLRLVG